MAKRWEEIAVEFGEQHVDAEPMFHDACKRLASQEERIADLEREAAREEKSHLDTIGERDRLADALQQTHIALGGDGEWCAKPGQTCTAGETGDLAVDVPALAAAVEQRLAKAKQFHSAEYQNRIALEAKLAEAEETGTGWLECLRMVRDDLEAMGFPMKATPPYCTNDAMRAMRQKAIAQAKAEEREAIVAKVNDRIGDVYRSQPATELIELREWIQRRAQGGDPIRKLRQFDGPDGPPRCDSAQGGSDAD